MDRDAIADIVMEAAAFLVQERGAEPLSLEGLAEATDLPVTEIRTVFPDMAVLTKAAVGRIYASFLGHVAEAVGDDDEPGAFTRGYVRAADPESGDRDDFTRLAAALLGSSPYRPEFVESVRSEQATLRAALDSDGIDPVTATIVRLAADGLWMNALFSIEPVTPERRRQVLDRLAEMARPPAGGGSGQHGAAFDGAPGATLRDGAGAILRPAADGAG